MKRKPFTEQTIFNVIGSQERFTINPLAWRNAGRMKILDRLEREGRIQCRRFKCDYFEYTFPSGGPVLTTM